MHERENVYFSVLWLGLALVSGSSEQDWSEQTYLGQAYTLTCNDSFGGLFISLGDKLTWKKYGNPAFIESNEDFELENKNGIDNMELVIRSVTPEMRGIYFCEVSDQYGNYLGRTVKGINIAGHLYRDALDKYRAGLITGGITAVIVCTLVLSVCAISRFRYLTEEQKQKRLDRKADKLKSLKGQENGGLDNTGLEQESTHEEGDKKTKRVYENTQL